MTNLVNHPGYWLRDDAAKSLARWEAAHGRLNLTDAGRTEAEQQHLIDRWYQGGAGNRPPYLFKPYEPAPTAPHVGGLALDTDQYSRFAQTSADYGWIHNLPTSDPVHFIYDPSRDKHRGGTTTAGGATANPQVVQQQLWLNKSSAANLVVDGIGGPATKAAIAKYQQFLKTNFGYTGAIDGVWGPSTQAAHAKYYAKSNAPKPPAPRLSLKLGMAGTTVKALQELLNSKYPAYSRLVVDGVYGPSTAAAVKEFQRRSGLASDGVVGPATYKALGL